jgi:hypothetical protein
MFPSPLLTRNQVELMQIDTLSSPEMPGYWDFAALGRDDTAEDAIELRMKSLVGYG